MSRILTLGIFIFVTGCTAVNVPSYLQDKRPYIRRVYATFPQTVTAVETALAETGWTIEKKLDPVVYEQTDKNLDGENLLLITQTRQTPMFLGTRYARMNIYIRSNQGVAEVEVRYLTITSIFPKNFRSYKNESAAERFLGLVEQRLNPS